MNWGYKIMIVFGLFVAGIVVLVVKASRQEQQLVTTGYYEKELVYQEQIDAVKNSSLLSQKLSAHQAGEQIVVFFPPEMNGREVNANLHLYCPSDEKQDRKLVAQTSDGVLKIVVPGIKAGKYYVKVSWTAGDKEYYDEIKLYVK